MLGTGKLSISNPNLSVTAPEIDIGTEYSGVTSGKRVMGLIYYGSFALQTKALPFFTWDVPDDWTLEDAATVPLVYSTVSYYLYT